VPRSPETRRRFLGRAALAAAGATLAARRASPAPAAPAIAGADAWPQFRGTPTLSGLSAATLPAQLSVAWQWEAGDAIESSAAIVAGTVYVGTRAGELVALELASGKPVWRYKVTGDGVGESSPCVAGGAVFVGDLAGQIHAVDAQSGKALWTHKTAQEVKEILDAVPSALRSRTGYGLDTCHLFCSGYDIKKSKQSFTAVLDEFEEVVGEPPSFFHLNDSATELGSNRDRHVLIGEGFIGKEPFGWLMQDRRSAGVPLILETPQQNYEIADDDDSPDPYDVKMMKLLEDLADK